MSDIGFGLTPDCGNEDTLVPGTLTGYRRFRFSVDTESLTAVAQCHVVITPGENTARHTIYNQSPWRPRIPGEFSYDEPHEAPREGCTCGFYGYYTPDLIDKTFNDNSWTCCAAVEVWGKVILGTKGFRAEKMRILGIVPPREIGWSGDVGRIFWDRVVRKHDVPGYRHVGALVDAHPPQDVRHLIPEPEAEPEVDPYYLYTGFSGLSSWGAPANTYLGYAQQHGFHPLPSGPPVTSYSPVVSVPASSQPAAYGPVYRVPASPPSTAPDPKPYGPDESASSCAMHIPGCGCLNREARNGGAKP
jgi:hypothetical protein